MTGQELYQKWVEFHESRAIYVDGWDDLDSVEQGAWNYLASLYTK